MIHIDKSGIKILAAAIEQLPQPTSTAWNSYYIDAEEPVVERLWHPIEYDDTQSWRVCLHRIQPSEQAFYHPHRHPSAVLLCQGSYEMGVGYGEPDGVPPPIFGPITLRQWDAYQMIHPWNWHYIRTIEGPSYSIMVTGEPHQKNRAMTRPKPRELKEIEIWRIFNFFTPAILEEARTRLRGLEPQTTVIWEQINMKDKELAEAFMVLPGVQTTHYYSAAAHYEGSYFIHLTVSDDTALRGLLDFADVTNCAVQVHLLDEEYHYTVIIPPFSRDNVIAWSRKLKEEQ